jgi:hypothetical protein
MSSTEPQPASRGTTGRTVAIILLLAVLLAVAAWVLGLFRVDTSGRLEAPEVSVSGGEVPEVEVETADIDVGTKTETIEIPTIEVTPPADDDRAQR